MMTTVEKNAVIASFMGYEKYYANGYWNFIYEDDNHRTDIDLHYHHDWNWLMETVIICFKRYDEVENESLFIADDEQFKLNDALLLTDIKALHEAVFQFIQWYNQKQETK
jgi:hypothetical protein